MEYQLFFSEFKSETTLSLAHEKIGGISGNRFIHRAVAFELGLRTALNLKKLSPQADTSEGVPSSYTGIKERISFEICLACASATLIRCGICERLRAICVFCAPRYPVVTRTGLCNCVW